MGNLTIYVILGSTRQNRFSEKPGQWMFEILSRREGVAVELVDLRDWPLPFFDDASPSTLNRQYSNDIAKKWSAKIDAADGFIVIAPEYNHGYPAVLKNAFDWLYPEWNNKAIGFVGYGSAFGSRSIEQLREVSVELQMAPVRNGVYLPGDIVSAARAAPYDPKLFQPMLEKAEGLIDQLLWWARMLKEAREKKSV